MKEVGIGELRQKLSALLDEVRKGREVTITDRGKVVARLLPPLRPEARSFAGRAAFRRKMPKLTSALSAAVLDGRSERT